MALRFTARLAHFWADQSGGTAVEWVTIAAASLAMLFAAMAFVSGGVENLATDTAQLSSNLDVANGFIASTPISASTDIVVE